MKNTQLILSVIGGFILGFLIYKVIKKYQSSRVGSSSDTTSGSSSNSSVNTSTPTSTTSTSTTSTSTGTGHPFPSESEERKFNVLKSFSKGGNTYGGVPIVNRTPKKGTGKFACAYYNSENLCTKCSNGLGVSFSVPDGYDCSKLD